MHRLFAPVIAPLIETLEPRAIAEIGAGAGRTTRRVLDAPGARDAVLHAVDPALELDPELVSAAGQRLAVYAERGVSAIGRIGAVDLALLDGDPNWYAVHTELTMLAKAAGRADRPAPLAIVHGIHWPFGRRDGYYDPSVIPEAHRKRHSDLGLVPGLREPRPEGLRLAPWCAVRDFEPASGVLTAVEDFVAGDEFDWTVTEVAGFHGVAVLAEAQLLVERPALQTILETLRSPRFLGEQVRRAESARLATEVELASIQSSPAPAMEIDVEITPAEPVRIVEEIVTAPELEALEPKPIEPSTDLLRELEAERAALQAELTEQRAQREAFEWRVSHLDQDLAAQAEHLVNSLRLEREDAGRAAVEFEVRAEHAAHDLDAERAVGAELRAKIKALEDELQIRDRELRDLAESERLAKGRLAHSQDAMEALTEERDRLRAEAGTLSMALEAAESMIEEATKHLDRAGSTRRARIRGRLAPLVRAATFRRAQPSHLESARAALTRQASTSDRSVGAIVPSPAQARVPTSDRQG